MFRRSGSSSASATATNSTGTSTVPWWSKLEDGVLRVGPGPAPGHRRGRLVDRRAVRWSPICRWIPSPAAEDRTAAAAAARHKRRRRASGTRTAGHRDGRQRRRSAARSSTVRRSGSGGPSPPRLRAIPRTRSSRAQAPPTVRPRSTANSGRRRLRRTGECGSRRRPPRCAASGRAVTAITRPNGSSTPPSRSQASAASDWPASRRW